MADREEAQRQRQEARQRRRGSAQPEPEHQQEQDSPQEPGQRDDAHETLLGAAKVAAAGAAVGAAFGAARALTSRNGGDDESSDEEPPADDAPDEHDEPTGEMEQAAGDEPDEPAEEGPEDDEPEEREPPPAAEQPPREPEPLAGSSPDQTSRVVERARTQLRALHGGEPESLSSLERTADGWTATFEVVELARVPDSTDVLASYEVVLDEEQNVLRYARVRRYYRAQADHGGDA